MTSRQRFLETMGYGRPDRVPWLDEGLRDTVLDRWREQGLPPDADLAAVFHYDRRERIELDLGPRPKLDRPVRTRADLDLLRSRLDGSDPSRLPRARPARDHEHIVELFIHSGLFLTLGVHDWETAEPLLCMLADDPDLARGIMDAHAELAAAIVNRYLAEVEVDFVSFSEPIGSTHGPLVSPQCYRRVALPGYERIIAAARGRGVTTFVYMTYANARPLLDDVLAVGFNCLWAMEAEGGAMDYRELRRRYGRGLRLIGGIDLDALIAGEEATDREMAEKVPPLLAEGGFIPLADGRVRAAVPWPSYVHYRRELERITCP